MKKPMRDSWASRINDDREVDSAVKEAVRKALAEHKRKGNPIAVWKGGQVALVKPDEIEIGAEGESKP